MVNVVVFLLLASSLRGWPHHVPDFPGAPALNGSSSEFAAFAANLSVYYAALLNASRTWGTYRDHNGIHFTTATDPDGGCPWLYATAELTNCSLSSSARFIVTDLPQFQRQWDKKLVQSLPQRRIAPPHANWSTLAVDWLEYSTGAVLSRRGYYNFGYYNFVDGGAAAAPPALVSPTASIYSSAPPPAGASKRTVRMAGRQWKRLTASGAASTRYEVLQLSDIDGDVPCGATLSGQASVLSDEIQAYRSIIPVIPHDPNLASSHGWRM